MARKRQEKIEVKPEPLGRRTRSVFTLIMLMVPILFFVFMEIGLRLSGTGATYPLFVELEWQKDYSYQNREVSKRYFSRIKDFPSSILDFFKTTKDTSIFRIFVQGESSAAGFPFYHGGAFSRMLEQRLQQSYPDRNIEIINTGMSAVNSYTLLDFADEIIEKEPDAILIYTGHNEFYGALGVGSTERFGSSPLLIRSYLKLMNLRTAQLLRTLIVNAAEKLGGQKRGEIPTGTLMQRVVGKQSIPYGSDLYLKGIRQFESNMSALLKKYQKHDIPIFFATLASNERDIPPFKSGHSEGADIKKWENAFNGAKTSLAQGDTATALVMLNEAVDQDSISAETLYARAVILAKIGRIEEAQQDFLKAKDYDELRFRASEQLNSKIRELGARYGGKIVDVQADFRDASPDGIIGSNLILEHLHPNIEGYLRVADSFFNALVNSELLGRPREHVSLEQARSEILLTPVDSVVGMMRIKQLKASWPFQPYGVVDRSLNKFKPANRIEEIAFEQFNDRVNWRESTENQRKYYESHGDYKHALQAILSHIQEYPFIPSGYISAGNNLIRQNRSSEAYQYFAAANDLEKDAYALEMMGTILLRQRNYKPAIELLKDALLMRPTSQQTLYNLGGAYAMTNRQDSARIMLERLFQIAPDHQAGRRLMASLTERNKRVKN